jgi:[ribosomal protein S18]-alanine N-acetyltransferase
MSNPSSLARPSLNLRRMTPRDLPHVLHIAKNLSAGRLALKHFLKVFQSGEAAGWVAEKDGCVVGFLIYTVSPEPAGTESETTGLRSQRLRGAKNPFLTKAPCVNLLNIVVAPEWRRQGIGRSMLEILNEGLWRTACSVQILVPETNLPLQLFLRAVGYKAIRVVRECFDAEDAYLMERQHR